MKAELKKGVNANMKLLHWVGAFLEASTSVCHIAFITFWLCKFIFGLHPHYAIKLVYLWLAIKISARVSLPLALMFFNHLYV